MKLDSSVSVAIAICLACVVGATANGQPPASQQTPKADETDKSGWQAFFKGMAEEYDIRLRSAADEKLKVLPKPILRWAQPVRGGDDGAVFLWLDKGRPAAVGTIFAWPDRAGLRVLQHEFHSLALEPLRAAFRDIAPWTPGRAGIELKEISGAPAPADTTTQRMIQMRALAREFTANSNDDKKGRWELRLMPQPVYRYEDLDNESLLDGALFVFAEGTDPEIFLIIEARRRGDAYHWQYACARFSDFPLQVRHKDREVWQAPRATINDGDQPHTYYVVEKRNPPKGPDK